MKKIVYLCATALIGFTGCVKEEQPGIPPIGQGDKPYEIGTTQLPTLEASEISEQDYVANKDKKVKLHGFIKMIQAGKNKKPHLVLKDGTQIQIYTKNYKAIPADVKEKLSKEGQEITITGVFTDYKISSSLVVKEIVYNSASDLVFGVVSESADATTENTTTEPTNPTESTNDTALETVEASTISASDFQLNKKVKIHGVIKMVMAGKSEKPHFQLQDGTLIQIYGKNYKSLPADVKEKINKQGQGVTVTGVFGEYKGTKQITYQSQNDLSFDASEPNTATDNEGESTPASSEPSTGNTNDNSTTATQVNFDFEGVIERPSTSYASTGDFTATDGTVILFKGKTEVKGDNQIDGQGLILKGDAKNGNSFIKITFKAGVKTLTFKYKGGERNTKNRVLKVVEGDENSTTVLQEETFKTTNAEQPQTITLNLNKSTDYTLTITTSNTSSQIVVDNISWTK